MGSHRYYRIWSQFHRHPSKVKWSDFRWFLERLGYTIDDSGGGSHWPVRHPAADNPITVVRPHGKGDPYVGAHYVKAVRDQIEELNLMHRE